MNDQSKATASEVTARSEGRPQVRPSRRSRTVLLRALGGQIALRIAERLLRAKDVLRERHDLGGGHRVFQDWKEQIPLLHEIEARVDPGLKRSVPLLDPDAVGQRQEQVAREFVV